VIANAICVEGKVIEKPGTGNSIIHLPPLNCEHKRLYTRLANFGEPATVYAHENCITNQRVSLSNRVLGEVPKPTPEGLKELRKAAIALSRCLPKTSTQDWYDMPNSYSGLKKLRYTLAADRVLQNGLTKADAKISAFVKFEKTVMNPEKVNPDPRMIQFRDPKYCVALSRFLKPIEHNLYAFRGDGRWIPQTRLVGKGLSQTERAMLTVKKWGQFQNPVCLSIDMSRFDKHVDRALLQIEHSVYTRCNNDPEFAQLLSWQLDNEGKTSHGIRYKTSGKRMSGDMNTALGNCIIVIVMVLAFMKGKFFDILDDGDDCLLFVEKSILAWVVETLPIAFRTYGMTAKIEGIAHQLSEIQWCQCKLVQTSEDVWKYVRSPIKVLATALGGTKYFTNLKGRRKILNTIGLGELVLNLGVPVLQEFALMAIRNAATSKFVELDEVDSMYFRLHRELKYHGLPGLAKVTPKPITDLARQSFSEAFGISVDEQLNYERHFSQVQLELGGDQVVGIEVDVTNWAPVVVSSPSHYTP